MKTTTGDSSKSCIQSWKSLCFRQVLQRKSPRRRNNENQDITSTATRAETLLKTLCEFGKCRPRSEADVGTTRRRTGERRVDESLEPNQAPLLFNRGQERSTRHPAHWEHGRPLEQDAEKNRSKLGKRSNRITCFIARRNPKKYPCEKCNDKIPPERHDDEDLVGNLFHDYHWRMQDPEKQFLLH